MLAWRLRLPVATLKATNPFAFHAPVENVQILREKYSERMNTEPLQIECDGYFAAAGRAPC